MASTSIPRHLRGVHRWNQQDGTDWQSLTVKKTGEKQVITHVKLYNDYVYSIYKTHFQSVLM